jgi:hypothetical protein
MANPDRTIILDLAAAADARGPQPNDFFVCVTPLEAGRAAVAIAYKLEHGCCQQKDCHVCNYDRRLFWDLVNELGPGLQGEVFASLLSANLGVPDGPWEEVR